MSETAIKVENLGKKYAIGDKLPYKTMRNEIAKLFTFSFSSSIDYIWALKNVSFEVKKGEMTGIIGSNGAGKSTLLKILSKITEPTEGYAEIHGRAGALLEVGTGFHSELTGRENIFLNGAMLGMKKKEIEKKFDEIVSFSEIEKFIDTPVKHYSSGMYVRLAFSVAAHLEVEIMFVDEVLAVGDIAFQKKCLDKMDNVVKQGRTVLFISHSMQAIRQQCQKTIWLKNGMISCYESTENVINDYLKNTLINFPQKNIQQQISEIPPDPSFRFKDILILQNNVPTTDVVNGQPVEICVSYETFEKLYGFRVYFELFDSEGTMLFESFHNGNEKKIPTTMPGSYVSRAFIPADFLNAIKYELCLKAAIQDIRLCTPNPVRISLNVIATSHVNWGYLGYRTPGKIAPLIEWKTECSK